MTIQELSEQIKALHEQIAVLTGSDGFREQTDGLVVQMHDHSIDRFNAIDAPVTYNDFLPDYPHKYSKTVNGVTYFFVTKKEYAIGDNGELKEGV